MSLWLPCVADADIIFLSGCFRLSFSFFTVRVDVYHTSTHGVALVRVLNAGLKCAAHGPLVIHDAKMTQKNRHLGSIAQLCWAVSSQIRHISAIGKAAIPPPHVLVI